MSMKALLMLALLLGAANAADPIVLDLWPGKPPGDIGELPPEADLTKPEDNLIAGRRIIKLGNVSTPQLAVFKPSKERDTGAAVVICPGGGHTILAYDLEGTEVAEWFNSIGVTGIVLKYRVPGRDKEKRWFAAVQDGQRAMSLARAHAEEWGIDPQRLGILGFSAGGQLAGYVSLFGEDRQYEPIDEADKKPIRPDVSMLIYAAGMIVRGGETLDPIVKVTKDTPPMFFVHAFDDGVDVRNPLLLAAELKKQGVSAEVHVYAKGGHGYGLRHVDGLPVTDWPRPCEAWLKSIAFLK